MKARELAEKILALPTDQQELPICFLDHDFGHMEIAVVEKVDNKLEGSIQSVLKRDSGPVIMVYDE